MQLGIIVFLLTLVCRSQCHLMLTNRSEFCQKVFECSRNSCNRTFPSSDNHILFENYTKTICEQVAQCDKPRNSIDDISSNISDSVSEAPGKWYTIHTNETELCSILNTCKDANSSTDMQHLRNLSQYCPNIDYCGTTDSLGVPNSESGVTSCCVSCSCNPDCGLHHECCFANQDSYNVIEAEQMACITLQSTYDDLDFYMLDKCPDGTSCSKPGSVPQPVSSASTKRIYINKECAKCNGNLSVSDFIPWPMAVSGFEFERVVSCMMSMSRCRSEYAIPYAHWVWIMNYGCGTYYRKSRLQSVSDHKEVFDVCSSVHAPLVVRGMPQFMLRKGVYCLMCHNATHLMYRAEGTCSVEKEPLFRGHSFLVVLDVKVVHAHKQKEPCADNDPGLQKLVGCRPVLCPEWMLRVDGTCVYVTKQWKAVQVSTNLLLRPSNPIITDLFQNMTKWDQFHVHTWLFNDCGLDLNHSKEKIFLRLYMLPVERENVMVVKEFLLRMRHTFDQLKPSTFYPFIERCIKGRWTIIRGNISYYLSASLYSYKYFMPTGSAQRSHLSRNNSLIENPLPRIYKYITISKAAFYHGLVDRYVDGRVHGAIVTTKLAFCERVVLTSEDVELLFGQIRVKKSGKVLGDSEFVARYERLDGEDRLINVNVCLEDFVENASSVGSYKSYHYIGLGIVLFVARCAWNL